MKHSVMKHLRREEGEAYIDVFVKLFVAMMLLCMIILIPGPIIKYNKLAYMCRNYTRAVESTGERNSNTERLLAELSNATSVYPVVSYTGFNYAAGTRVQLRERFSVTMQTTHVIKLMDWPHSSLVINIPLRVTSHGVGEVYFK